MTFYIGPLFLMPMFTEKLDYMIHSNVHSHASNQNIVGYRQQLPSSDNPHFLTMWPMNWFYDWLISSAFVSVDMEMMNQKHSFLKVRFALMVCYVFVNRVTSVYTIIQNVRSLKSSQSA